MVMQVNFFQSKMFLQIVWMLSFTTYSVKSCLNEDKSYKEATFFPSICQAKCQECKNTFKSPHLLVNTVPENQMMTPKEILTWIRTMKEIDYEITGDCDEKTSDELIPDQMFLPDCQKSLTIRNFIGTQEKHAFIKFPLDSVCAKDFEVLSVNGSFSNGLFHGTLTIQFKNETTLKGSFCHGKLIGIVRLFTCPFGSCDFDQEHWNTQNWLSEISFYENGSKRGNPMWKFKIGGGIVLGIADSLEQLTGQDVAYIYPDFKTALVGDFESGTMKCAGKTSLKSYQKDWKTGIPKITFGELRTSKCLYNIDESTKWKISSNPLLRDPYEDEMVYVGRSKVAGAGLGLFSRHSLKKGVLVAFYNGIRLTSAEGRLNIKGKENSYNIDNDWASPTQIMDIPEQYRNPHSYNATLGHFINHGTEPNCAFGMIEHPRFGKIRSVVLTQNISANEELFTGYGYLDDFMRAQKTYKTIFDFGRLLTQKDDVQYVKSLKNTIKFLKQKSKDSKPWMNIIRSAIKIFGES